MTQLLAALRAYGGAAIQKRIQSGPFLHGLVRQFRQFSLLFQNFLDCTGDRVRAGSAAHSRLADRRRAADALELGQNFRNCNTGAQGHGCQPCNCLRLRRTAAVLAGAGEHLADAVLIRINCNEQGAAADFYLPGDPADQFRAGPGKNFPCGVLTGSAGSFGVSCSFFSDWPVVSTCPSREPSR